MVAAVAEAVRPRRVVLFGSHATGEAGPGSDVDLLIVEDRPFQDERACADELVRAWALIEHVSALLRD